MGILSELDNKLVLRKCFRLLEIFSNGSIEIKYGSLHTLKYQEKYYEYVVVKEKHIVTFSKGSRKKICLASR